MVTGLNGSTIKPKIIIYGNLKKCCGCQHTNWHSL